MSHGQSALRVLCALAAFCLPSAAQNVLRIDATAPQSAPSPVAMMLGSARAPDGRTIGANSQYLTLDGKPWIPVMGEFHFSRYPAEQWEQEILNMKAAGVDVIATYVIWIHHEQNEGEWNWGGQRDLRAFAELCRKHGMYLYPRIGPWAHAETRNGGLPDWVLKKGPVRRNDPVYMAEVQQFYTQIATQLKGELWKDGGPVIGIQIENEYHDEGPGRGAEHIRTLKKMAIADGLDVPLYTVTGWDGAAIPLDAVLPVFGGYPDAPWAGTAAKLPPNEIYAFRFDNRSAGSMGVIGGGGQNAASSYAGTPFLTAEVGDGIEDTYFRRPVVSADDVAAIPTVMLGSGANLLGYYMFHGGRNPDGGAITLQESQRTGYPTDVPAMSYDFQAPIGEFGQERESLRKLKLVHYFLNDFGDLLAPMSPRRPDKLPSTPGDLTVPRVAARTSGDSGFIFFSNYVRGASMPTRDDFQIELALPSGVTRIPARPMALPGGAYGIWPVNLALPGATLRYSTAQLFKRIVSRGETWFFFSAIPGIAPEFALDAPATVTSAAGAQQSAHNVFSVHEGDIAELQLAGGVHIVLLPQTAAEDTWRVDDPALLLQTAAAPFSDGGQWTLQTMDEPSIRFGVFGSEATPMAEGLAVQPEGKASSLFRQYRVALPPIRLQAEVHEIHPASPRAPWQYGPAFSWRPTPVPMSPDDAEFRRAAAWSITVPRVPQHPHVTDLFLQIGYNGDAARLYQDGTLVDDSFWNGLPWQIGLREIGWNPQQRQSFTVRVLPLPKNYPMYIEQSAKLRFGKTETVTTPPRVRLLPEYRLVLHAPEGP